jgi:hypothetical protein
MAKKERVIPPKKAGGTKASGGLKKGDPISARYMADSSVVRRSSAADISGRKRVRPGGAQGSARNVGGGAKRRRFGR